VGTRVLATIFAVIGAAASAGAWAQDGEEGPRFESLNVLESLDLLANQRENLDVPEKTGKDGSDLAVDFSFHGKRADRESGFLYLRDGSSPETPEKSRGAAEGSGFTPRLSALEGLDASFDARGRARSLPSFTPRYAAGEFSLKYDPEGVTLLEGVLGFGITSQYLREAPNITLRPSNGFGDLDPLARESVNLGVFLDYSGLRMGASLTRETGGMESGYEGIDIGLGYEWASFSTQLSIGDYSVLEPETAPLGLDRDFTRLELGAAYAVSERLRLSGGMRLFDYGERFGLVAEGRDPSGVLYLGTQLNF